MCQKSKLNKLFILSFISFVLAMIIVPAAARAEVVSFRDPRETQVYQGTDINKGDCWKISLSENISAKINGDTGPGCEFSADVFLSGEWVFTGSYYDTPPYAWDEDVFYGLNTLLKPQLSFTCSSPAYSLNSASLPSFVTLVKEENLAPVNTTSPLGKRYFFKVADNAPGTSFNIGLGAESDCDMKRKQNDGAIERMFPVDPGERQCGKAEILEINPREAAHTLKVTMGSSCVPPSPTSTPAPTSTPVPTATPVPTLTSTPVPTATPLPTDTPVPTATPIPTSTPTSTPIPTATPTPTATLTPTPTYVPCGAPCTGNICDPSCSVCSPGTDGGVSTCRLSCNSPCTSDNECPLDCPACAPGKDSSATVCRTQASCECDGFEYAGEIGAGKTVTFISYGKVSDPENNDALMLNMTFVVTKDGTQIARSPAIAVSAPERTVDTSGKTIDRYSSSWDFTVPAENASGSYAVKSEIKCGYRSEHQVPAQAVGVANEEKPGFFVRLQSEIVRFLATVFSYRRSTQEPAGGPAFVPNSSQGADTLGYFDFDASESAYYRVFSAPTPTTMLSVKLGTFEPPPKLQSVQTFCKQMVFTLSE